MEYLDDNLFGYLNGPDEKIRRFVNGNPLATVDRDSGNGWYRPGNIAQWSTVRTVASLPTLPVSAYDCQTLSGATMIDLLSTKHLTISGSVSYQVSISGASTKGISGSSTASNQFASNTSVENPSLVDTMILAYAVTQIPAATHQRIYWGSSSNWAWEGFISTDFIRYRISGSSGNGTLSHGSVLNPYVIIRRAGLCAIYSWKEKRLITSTVPANATTFNVQFRTSTDVLSSTVFNYIARFAGDLTLWTDSTIKAMIQTLTGLTVTGY